MKKNVLFLFIFFSPFFCLAEKSFVISEIMINPSGSDSGREWIEVTNLGPQTGVDGFKFKEGADQSSAVSHGITIPAGGDPSWLIGKDKSFLVVSNPDSFYLDYPDYEEKLFDSSFSLVNSGEYLSILDSGKNILFEIDVTEEMIPEEGQTICLVEDIWKKCNPNPGRVATQDDVISAIISGENDEDGVLDEENPSQTSNSNQGLDQPVVEQTYIEIKDPDYRQKVIKADGGGDRVILAGSEFLFEAKSYGFLGGELKNPKYKWNFGDGKTEEGKKALHIYHYPGNYTASVSAKIERHVGVDRFKIKVIEPDLEIVDVSKKDGYVKIKNKTLHNLDISFFNIVYEDARFKVPENTFIESGAEIIFPEEYTKIALSDGFRVKLQTPNRKNISVYEDSMEEKKVIPESVDKDLEKTDFKTEVRPPVEPKVVYSVKESPIVKELPSVDETQDEVIEVNKNKEPNFQKAQVPQEVNGEKTYFYEIVFMVIMSTLATLLLFMKPKNRKESDNGQVLEIKKEAKKFKINER
jgi:hypothetical protein